MTSARTLQGLFVVALVTLVNGCTTLGPVPGTTGLPFAPLDRAGVEVQAGATPGYYLSSLVTPDPSAAVIPQVAALVEPGRILRMPGVVVGARYAGSDSEGAALEPVLGYRRYLDDDQRLAAGAIGFFAWAKGQQRSASFESWRGGVESGLDGRLTPRHKVIELHANVGAALTALSARGRYCEQPDGHYAADCPEDMAVVPPARASVSGAFPSVRAGLALDFGRHLRGPFRGVRLALDLQGGLMPTVVDREQRSFTTYAAAGLSLAVGLGQPD